LRHDWGFRATPPENSMRRLAQIRLLIIDDFALQPMDATETADANTLG
jgi:DNA replication protein DnaC